MQTLQFPMTLTHRDNPHAQVVVANAEQLAQMPEEYLPIIIGTAATSIPGVNLDVSTTTSTVDAADLADLAERRQSLDEAVDEFTAHVQTETAKIDAVRLQLHNDRVALADQMEALARERAEFEAQRASTSTTAGTGDIGGDAGAASSTAEGAGTGDIAKPAATPAKRTRAATKEGA